MIIRVRPSLAESGYWLELIADSGQIIASSGVYASQEAALRIAELIRVEAADARVVDMSLARTEA